ncbi:MAG: FoF1 ATP synthase subunit gamma [Halanaerobiales bacterium]
MMETLHKIKDRMESAEDLKSVIRTMKSHASSNIAQFQDTAEASQSYRDVLDMALYVTLKNRTEKSIIQKNKEGNIFHIIFGSDHGLAGKFNERIANFALQEIYSEKNQKVMVIGQRIIPRIEEYHQIASTFSIPQTEEGIISIVQKLLFKIDENLEEGTLEEIILYFNKPTEGVSFEETKETFYPIKADTLITSVEWNSRSIPQVFMDCNTLFSDLVKQYIFITLYRTFCQSLISENTSRLSSMESAEKNIDERLSELESKYRRHRQNSITEEITDVISGFKAVKKSKS